MGHKSRGKIGIPPCDVARGQESERTSEAGLQAAAIDGRELEIYYGILRGETHLEWARSCGDGKKIARGGQHREMRVARVLGTG